MKKEVKETIDNIVNQLQIEKEENPERVFLEPSATKEEIKAIEDKWGIKLPKEYVYFLQKINGFTKLTEDYDEEIVFGISDIDDECDYLYSSNDMPHILLPISKDGYGNLLCIDMQTDELVGWDHETYDDNVEEYEGKEVSKKLKGGSRSFMSALEDAIDDVEEDEEEYEDEEYEDEEYEDEEYEDVEKYEDEEPEDETWENHEEDSNAVTKIETYKGMPVFYVSNKEQLAKAVLDYKSDSEPAYVVILPNNSKKVQPGAFGGVDDETIRCVILPDSIYEIGNAAFSSCLKLTDIVISEGVEKISDTAFFIHTELSNITVSEKNKVYKSINNCLLEKKSSKLILGGKLSIIPEGVKTIGFGAFSGCTGLTEIAIPNNVHLIDDYAFYGCTGLTDIIIPESVIKIGENAFENCTGLTSIVIPKSVSKISRCAFCCCDRLTNVIISAGVEEIEDYAFLECSALTDIVIPDSVTYIGDYAFESCTGLNSVVIPKRFENRIAQIFEGCEISKMVIKYI